MLVYVYIYISISIYATEPNKIKIQRLYQQMMSRDSRSLKTPPPTQILCWDLHHQRRSCRPTLKNPSAAVHFCRFCGPNHCRSHSCSMAGRRRYQKVKGHKTKDRQSHHHQNLGPNKNGVPKPSGHGSFPWSMMESHGKSWDHCEQKSEASTKKLSLNILAVYPVDGST